MPKLIPTLFAANLALLTAFPSAAHEFWLEPLDFTISPGAQIEANLRVGQDFDGALLSYIPRNFTRFEVAVGGRVLPVEGRMGEKPALQMAAPGDGLAVILYETTDTTLTYDSWDVFARFVTHKDFAGVLERHVARGLPETGFSELYSRHVKSLVAVGDGAGQDREFGLRTEFVALANPYTDDVSGGLPVQLLLEGVPRVDVQVELWERAPDGTVTVAVLRTDSAGQTLLPVTPGHIYMADAVTMLELTPEAPRDPVWMSLWASLTFEVPTP